MFLMRSATYRKHNPVDLLAGLNKEESRRSSPAHLLRTAGTAEAAATALEHYPCKGQGVGQLIGFVLAPHTADQTNPSRRVWLLPILAGRDCINPQAFQRSRADQ